MSREGAAVGAAGEGGGFMDKAKAAYEALAAAFGQADKTAAEQRGMEERASDYRAGLHLLQETSGDTGHESATLLQALQERDSILVERGSKSPIPESMVDTLEHNIDRVSYEGGLLAEGKTDEAAGVQAKIAAKQKENDYLQRGAPEDVAWNGGMWARDDQTARQNIADATRSGMGSGDGRGDVGSNCCCTAIEHLREDMNRNHREAINAATRKDHSRP
jgi:hypothetical protein